ncbi:MAG: PIN domain-containing protein [Phaeospirillum sp.]|nr:PIN domain-containing protein [Phaeospirillum sp.]
MRYVLDTDCGVAAMRSPTGASAALVLAALDGRLTLLMSVPLAVEYEAACMRLEHWSSAGLSEREVGVYLDGLVALATPVKSRFLWRPRLRDPGDEMVLEAAANGRADAIVTFNIRDFGVIPSQFGVLVSRPAEALRRMRP